MLEGDFSKPYRRASIEIFQCLPGESAKENLVSGCFG
jgi:hypothetical protein